jgi:hypothetical protein
MSYFWLAFFGKAQALAAIGGLFSWGIRRAVGSGRLPVGPREEARLHLGLMLAAIFFTALPTPGGAPLPLVATRVELGRTFFAGTEPRNGLPESILRVPGLPPRSGGAPLGACAAIALALFAFGLGIVGADYLRLSRVLRRATVFRALGRVRIAVADGIASPFSARTPRAAWVVVPPSFLRDAAAFRIAVAHELQHHRAGDSLACHLAAPWRALCFFHPLRALQAAATAEAQELACDEVLVNQRRRVGAGDYARCLIRAAESAAKGREGRAIAAAPSLFSERHLLVRRIESMYTNKRNVKWVTWALGIAAGITLACGARAGGAWVIDSRVTGRQMAEMAVRARQGTSFPIAVNDDVLRELNRFLGTERGREYVRNARERLARMRPLLERELADRRVPEELLAVGLIESGFENLPESANPQKSAGVWQFIPSTARAFGLRVDDVVDERLDVEKETDAAFRYLAANQLRFGNWLLGIMAYNMGERALDAAIQRAGTRDPWKLVAMGHENDRGYLAKFMAGLLILKNQPESR